MKVYEGTEPFIFVSYAHKDADHILPIIEGLIGEGFRVWYDAGIEAGTEWPEYIANHLLACHAMLAFVSENFDRSQNCRREIHYAVSHRKRMLAVYLEDFTLSPGLELQLGAVQSIAAKRHTDESLISALTHTAILQDCRGDAPATAPTEPAEPSQDFVIENDVLIQYTGNDSKLRIPDGVRCIAKQAFMENTSLTEVSIPDSVKFIDNGAFCHCSALESVLLPNKLITLGTAKRTEVTERL